MIPIGGLRKRRRRELVKNPEGSAAEEQVADGTYGCRHGCGKWHRKFEGMGPHVIAPSAVAPASREQCEPGVPSVRVKPLETAAEDRNGSGRWPNFSRRPLAAAA